MNITRSGRFIVIEGPDGSGKTIQTEMLVAKLEQIGLEVAKFDFPQYGNPRAKFVENYLNGEYGDWRVVGPKEASLFFMVDRLEASPRIRQAIREGKIAVSNRFVASNMGHQGAKFANSEERWEFFKWNDEWEHVFLGIPRPSSNVFLHVPAVISYELVARKKQRDYLKGGSRDIHESDISHLKLAEQSYLELERFYPDTFKVVECAPVGATRPEEMFSPEAIHAKVWELVEPLIVL